MNCFLCGKKIGLFRSLSDQQYCCSAHRKEARMASANAVREEEDVESWAVARSRRKSGATQKNASPASQAGIVLAVVGIGAVMIGVLSLGGPAPKGVAYPSVSLETGEKPSMFARAGGALSDWIGSIAPVTLQQEFKGGILSNMASSAKEWSTTTLRAGTEQIDDPRDWIGKTKTPASLRLWTKSTAMENYRMEFQGELQKTSFSFVVRARDSKNYFAARVGIIKTGPLMNAGVLKVAVVNGREVERQLNPLPMRMERGQSYRISAMAQDNQINIYLNGSWIGRGNTDQRLSRGGVGFVDDPSDPQKIDWVSVSERDSFLGRMLAHFALFHFPGEPLTFE
jgi:hypothetical protein